MDLQKLPIGEQSFEKLRTENRLYVDKETILIGLNFSTTTRRPKGWIIERGDGTRVECETQGDTQGDT